MIIPKAVFFDMDGVLYDSMPNHELSWQKAFAAHGVGFDAVEAYINEGRTARGTIDTIFLKRHGRRATDAEVESIYRTKTALMSQCPAAPAMPAMQPFVEFLRTRGIAIVVVTGSRQPSLIDKLSRDYGVDSQYIVSGADVVHGKPDPEPYLTALGRVGMDARECAVVENAPLGVRSAKAAGLFTVAVNTGKLPDRYLLDEHCDALFAGTEPMCKAWKEIIDRKH